MYPAPKSTLRDVHWGANWSGCTAARTWRVGELSSPAAFEGPPATVTCVGGRAKGRPMHPVAKNDKATASARAGRARPRGASLRAPWERLVRGGRSGGNRIKALQRTRPFGAKRACAPKRHAESLGRPSQLTVTAREHAVVHASSIRRAHESATARSTSSGRRSPTSLPSPSTTTATPTPERVSALAPSPTD